MLYMSSVVGACLKLALPRARGALGGERQAPAHETPPPTFLSPLNPSPSLSSSPQGVSTTPVYVRTFLTVKVLDSDNCLSVDTGFEHASDLYEPANLPTSAVVNERRPPYCTWFGGKVNGTLCQQPFLRQYFDMPGVNTSFQPFKTAQLDWEPEGHAPMGEHKQRERGGVFFFSLSMRARAPPFMFFA